MAAYFISLGRARSSSGKWPGRAGWRAGFAPGGFRACDPGSRLLFRRATAPAGACVTRARASPALGLRRGAREGLKAKSSPAAAPRLPGPLAPQPEMPPRVRASSPAPAHPGGQTSGHRSPAPAHPGARCARSRAQEEARAVGRGAKRARAAAAWRRARGGGGDMGGHAPWLALACEEAGPSSPVSVGRLNLSARPACLRSSVPLLGSFCCRKCACAPKRCQGRWLSRREIPGVGLLAPPGIWIRIPDLPRPCFPPLVEGASKEVQCRPRFQYLEIVS